MKKYTSIQDLELLSESALESSLAGYWDWNMVSNEEYLSPRFKQMFGYDDDEMENKPESWQKIAFQEDLPKMFEGFETHVKSHGKVPFNSIVRYHHKNGNTVWVRCNGKVVEWPENNEPLRAIGCHIDITDEKEMEARLKKAIKERDTLLKEVHHRVKNNLQLLLSLSRLKNKNGKIETQEIEDSINSIAIAYEAIYKSENLDKISISSYLKQILSPIVTAQNLYYNIESIEHEENIDFLVPIGLIITELANNSLKHARISSKELKVEINITKEHETLFINYCDNGKGYGEKLNSFRESNSFGLDIIEGLAEQLNGSIKIFDKGGACAELKINLSQDDL
jgi:PAS domain S-box-containing protein